MQLRKVLLVLALTIAFSAITVPRVRAQSTSITHLDAPTNAFVGQSVTVRVGVTYDLGSNGYAVSIGIFDLNAWWAYGTATSEENTCHQFTSGQVALQAFCGYIPNMHSGSDVVIFQLTFSTVKTYRLRASVELYDSHANLISGVNTFQDFSITVQSQGYTTPANSYTLPAVSTTSPLQMPQPPQPMATQPTDNTPQLLLAFVVIAAVAIGAAFLYMRRQERPRATEKVEPKTEKVDIDAAHLSTRTVEGERFCIECGNELPSKSKFCNNCGTEQP